MRVAALINAAGRAVAGFVEGIRDALASAHQRLKAPKAKRFGKFARLEAGDLKKRPAQGRWRRAKRLGQLMQSHAFFGKLGEKVRGALDQCDRSGNFVGAAAQAGSITMPLRLLARPEERDVPAQRPACRARRAAIDTRRAHGKNESAVGAGIARPRGAPVARGGMRRDGLRGIDSSVCHAPCPVQQHQNRTGKKAILSGKARQSDRDDVPSRVYPRGLTRVTLFGQFGLNWPSPTLRFFIWLV